MLLERAEAEFGAMGAAFYLAEARRLLEGGQTSRPGVAVEEPASVT
jgi:hypothetical protein